MTASVSRSSSSSGEERSSSMDSSSSGEPSPSSKGWKGVLRIGADASLPSSQTMSPHFYFIRVFKEDLRGLNGNWENEGKVCEIFNDIRKSILKQEEVSHKGIDEPSPDELKRACEEYIIKEICKKNLFQYIPALYAGCLNSSAFSEKLVNILLSKNTLHTRLKEYAALEIADAKTKANGVEVISSFRQDTLYSRVFTAYMHVRFHSVFFELKAKVAGKIDKNLIKKFKSYPDDQIVASKMFRDFSWSAIELIFAELKNSITLEQCMIMQERYPMLKELLEEDAIQVVSDSIFLRGFVPYLTIDDGLTRHDKNHELTSKLLIHLSAILQKGCNGTQFPADRAAFFTTNDIVKKVRENAQKLIKRWLGLS